MKPGTRLAVDPSGNAEITPRRRQRGMTLVELFVILLLLSVVTAILYPVFAKARGGHPRQNSCASNLKQIALAVMQYTQDYDDTLPIAGYGPGGPYWGGGTDSLIFPYLKSESVFRCWGVKQKNTPRLTYMYNDLAAGERQSTIKSPSYSVMVTENADLAANVGHARVAAGAPVQPGVVNGRGICDPGRGATTGPALTRHNGAANYAFLDGHVKWLKPDVVYFPPQSSNSSTYREHGAAIGPDPAGSQWYAGRLYQATLHVR